MNIESVIAALGPSGSAVIIVFLGIRWMMHREKRQNLIADQCHDIMERAIRMIALCEGQMARVEKILNSLKDK